MLGIKKGYIDWCNPFIITDKQYSIFLCLESLQVLVRF